MMQESQSQVRVPNEIKLKYSSHAKKEWVYEETGLIKNPPLKFLKLYTRHEVLDNGVLKAFYKLRDGRKLTLVINYVTGVVITNYCDK